MDSFQEDACLGHPTPGGGRGELCSKTPRESQSLALDYCEIMWDSGLRSDLLCEGP